MADGFIGVVVALAVVLGGACSVKSIDSVKNKQLDLCQQIKDEHTRADCIVRVGLFDQCETLNKNKPACIEAVARATKGQG